MFNLVIVKAVISDKCHKQKGVVLVVVLIFLAAISLFSVSSISSAQLQLILLNNQQIHNRGLIQLSNVKQLILHQLTSNEHSAHILQLPSILNRNGKIFNSITCGQTNNNWLALNLAGYTGFSLVQGVKDITSYVARLSVELTEPMQELTQKNNVIDVSSERSEILLIQQCLQLQHSDLWIVDTTIITRIGKEQFSVSVNSQNRQIKLLGTPE